MKRLHPITLALLAASGLEPLPRREPTVTSGTVATEPLKRSADPPKGAPLRDLQGQPVRALAQRPSGDQNPEGKAAARRRKQMERQKLAAQEKSAADSCEASRADRQNPALVVFDEVATVPPEAWASIPSLHIDEFAGGYFNQPGAPIEPGRRPK